MAQRTYRVIVRGRFDGLDEQTRSRLRAEASEHDVLTARFTDEGTLTYDAGLENFQHRVVVRVESGPDEEGEAHTTAQLAAMRYLDEAGVGYRDLRSSATCVDDVKVRRR